MRFDIAALSIPLLAASATLGLVYGSFDSEEVRTWDSTAQVAFKVATFPAAFTAPPSFAVGLTGLNISNAADIRVYASAANVTTTSAYIRIDTWGDTRLHSAASVWLALPSSDPSFQTGRFATTADHPVDKPQQNNTHRITFARPYAAPPRVVVWLDTLDMDRTKNWRVVAWASDVTAAAFTLHIDTWGDSILYAAAAHWVAYPGDMPGVLSGTYSTNDVRSEQITQLATNGTIAFPEGAFPCDPTVLLALNYLDVGSAANLRLRASANPVSHSGMAWHFDSWGDSLIYAAGASYLAFAPS